MYVVSAAIQLLAYVISPLSIDPGRVSKPPVCKVSYTSRNWPSLSKWTQLNRTLDGKLLAPLPASIVCDPESPHYDSSACAAIDRVWLTEAFHDNDPLSLHQSNWQNDACLPPFVYNGSNPCDVTPFAKYVVNASTADHVVTAIKFASDHNIRVSVKNTGHDYLGRSTSPGFQIWTHHLKGLEFHPSFEAQHCFACEKVAAVTVHGGNQYGEVYNFTDQHDVVLAGGENPSVGVGGHFTGGGHSPLGSMLGLAVDNALEMRVVTPQGNLVTANACQNKDLFWAMRGGGGSTFGVLISVTMKVFKTLPCVRLGIAFGSTDEDTNNGSEDFYSLLADLHSEMVAWSDEYVNGYSVFGPLGILETPSRAVHSLQSLESNTLEKQFFTGLGLNEWKSEAAEMAEWSDYEINRYSGVRSQVALGTPLDADRSTLSRGSNKPMEFFFSGWGLNRTKHEFADMVSAFVAKLNSTQGVQGQLILKEVPKTSDLLHRSIQGPAGPNVLLASRLWDKEALLDREGLIKTFKSIEPNMVQGLWISGPAVRNHTKIEETAVTPAWRDAYYHLLVATTWSWRNSTAETEARTTLTELSRALQDHAPETGAYLNEADPQQPNPGYTFWGENYGRLLSIKRRIDPKGTFWCTPCVGSEDWTMDEETGQLCRAP